MGRYVPPDLEGRVSFNRASGKGHALGSRARKLASEGVLTVRFECPFAIWCTTCQPEQIIGQGVRFNAEKKKVGNYYSTPIWSFRFKHVACGAWIEVRTDPKASEYVVMEGGRRRDYGEGRREAEWGTAVVASEEEKMRLEKEGGFAALEKQVDEKREKVTQQKRVEELYKASERDWSDPYERSQALRREFRMGRRKRQADGKTGEALQEKYGIGAEMLETTSEDAQRAAEVDFGDVKVSGASSKPLFAEDQPQPSPHKERDTHGKAKDALGKQKSTLQAQLKSSTRTNHDPFLQGNAWEPRTKRRKLEDDGNMKAAAVIEEPSNPTASTLLVAYDSE